MTDLILIRGLLVRTILGVHEWERRDRRDVVLDLALETDLAAPCASDDLADTVDYGAVTRLVAGHLQEARFQLLERLAGSVADVVLDSFPQVGAVTVTADKPGAAPWARSVAVRIRRAR